jgi:hypothetical protein
MRRSRRLPENLKYLAVAALAVSATAFFFLHGETGVPTPPVLSARQAEAKQQAGYRQEDRQKLEKLIHEGSKDD